MNAPCSCEYARHRSVGTARHPRRDAIQPAASAGAWRERFQFHRVVDFQSTRRDDKRASPRDLAHALEQAGIPSTPAGDGSIRTDADPARVGAVALTAGIALTELRSAEGAGLEDMFLSLTADTQREGVAA